MCGRFALRSSSDELARQFGLADVPLFEPNDNIAPSARVLAVRSAGATLLRWGLKGKMHNVRSETAAGKFARAYAAGRCLLPASGFYEWKRVGAGKQPFFVRPARGGLFAFAGLWERGECAVLTVEANETLRPIHHRMPAIIAGGDYARWLGGEDGLLVPAADAAVAVEPLASEIDATGGSGSLFGD
jgi:putative SOS response-associated peptidase YedK